MHDEYQALRDELLVHFQIPSQYYLTTILATGAVLSLAFTSQGHSRWLLLAPLIVILPNALNYASRSEALTRTGTYVEIFHEEAQGRRGWETRLGRLSPQLGSWAFNTPLNRFLYTLVFLGLGALCLVLFLSRAGLRPLPIGVASGAAALPALAEWRLLQVPSRRETYLRLWRKILEEER